MAILAAGTVSGARQVHWAFTDRTNGASLAPFDEANLANHVGDSGDSVAQNRRSLVAMLGPDLALASMSQVHGAEVAVVDSPGPAGEADALVTHQAGVVLLVMTADCVPVVLMDAQAGLVACVHSGWKGAAADVVGAAVAVLRARGAREVEAVIGPAICGQCYEVGPDVLAQVSVVLPEAATLTRTGTPGLDIRAGIAAHLERLAVPSEVVGPCTYESAHLFSYRREGRTGRQGGLVWMDPA